MPSDPDYIYVRQLMLEGKINTIEGLFAALPIPKLARDLCIEEEDLVKIIMNIGHMTIEQMEQLSDIIGIPHPILREMILNKVEKLFAKKARKG